MSSLPPGPSEHSFAQLYRYVDDAVAWHEDLLRRYGPIYTVRLPGQPPTVHVALPEVIRRVFESRGDDMDSGEVARPVEFLIGSQALPRLDGARHQRTRKIVSPAISGRRLTALGPLIRTIVNAALEPLRSGDRVEARDLLERIVLGVVAETLFGVGPGPRQERFKRLLAQALAMAISPAITAYSMVAGGDGLRRGMARAAAVLERAPTGRALLRSTGWGRLAACVHELDALLYEEIAARRPIAADRDDILAALIQERGEDGESLTDKELRDVLMGMLLAGLESTTSTLTWALMVVADRPDVPSRPVAPPAAPATCPLRGPHD